MFCAVTEEAQLEGLRTGTIVVDSRGDIHQRLLSGWWKERSTGTTSTPDVEYPALIIAYGQDIIRELEKLRESKQVTTEKRIYSIEQLNELPVGSVVLDSMGDAWQYSDYHDGWVCAGYWPSEDDAGIDFYFPVTLIYEGEEIDD